MAGIFKFIPFWEHAMAMNVIARKAFKASWERYPHAETPLGTWFEIVSKGNWNGPADLKTAFGASVDFIGDNRAIFDIGGNKYRLVVHFSYRLKTALIKFVGTHEEYEGVDAETV
jgi:mRNA interferase HigB